MNNAVKLLLQLKNHVVEMDKFCNSCPISVQDFVINNDYSNLQGMMIDKLIQFEFGNSSELVFMWLYDDKCDLYKCTAEEIVQKLDEDWHKQNQLCGA